MDNSKVLTKLKAEKDTDNTRIYLYKHHGYRPTYIISYVDAWTYDEVSRDEYRKEYDWEDYARKAYRKLTCGY